MDRAEKLEMPLGKLVQHINGTCNCDEEFMCHGMRFATGNITLDDALDEFD